MTRPANAPIDLRLLTLPELAARVEQLGLDAVHRELQRRKDLGRADFEPDAPAPEDGR